MCNIETQRKIEDIEDRVIKLEEKMMLIVEHLEKWLILLANKNKEATVKHVVVYKKKLNYDGIRQLLGSLFVSCFMFFGIYISDNKFAIILFTLLFILFLYGALSSFAEKDCSYMKPIILHEVVEK